MQGTQIWKKWQWIGTYQYNLKCKWIFSQFLFLIFLCWYTKMPFISEYWLCILLFCQIHLLGRVVFWWRLIGFSMHAIMSSTNNDSLPSSFPVWMPFIYFSCLITMAIKLPVLCLIRVVKVGAIVFFLILKEMILVFAHWLWCCQ